MCAQEVNREGVIKMATKTYGKEDIELDEAVKNQPFIYEAAVQHEVHSKNAAILAHSIAVDTGVTRLYAKTRNGQTLEVIFDEPLMNGRHWVFVDSAYGATYYAQRNARVIRNGIRIQPVGGVGYRGCRHFDGFSQVDPIGCLRTSFPRRRSSYVVRT